MPPQLHQSANPEWTGGNFGLQESEDRLRLFVTATNSIVYQMNADWTRMENLVGKELLADTTEPTTDWVDKYILQQDQPAVWMAIQNAIANKSVFDLEHRVKLVDGSVGWVHSRAIPLLNDRGAIAAWFGAGTDITERRRVEDILQQSEEKYRTVFERMDEGFCIYELIYDETGKAADLKWIEINPAYEKQTGLKDVVGKTHSDVSPDTEQHWFDFYDKVVKTGEAVHFEDWHEPTGRWYSTFASRIGGAGSRQVAVLFSDITERRQREEQQGFLLKLSDTLRAETGVGAIGDRAVRMIARQLKADRVYLVTLNSYDDEVVITHETKREDMPPLKGSYRSSDFPSAIKEIFERTIVYNDVRTDARLSDLERLSFAGLSAVAFIAAPIRRGEEAMIWAAGALCTEPRTWQPDEIELFEDAVERSWAAIDRAKAEEALRKSETQLKQLLKMRDEFIGIASHELKTPVTSMKAYAEMVKEYMDETGDTDNSNLLSKLTVQIDRLTTLINSLLDTTKMSEGQLTLHLQLLNINELISERAGEIKRTSNHIFDLQLQDIPAVLADRERIGQVMTNLLSNAIKYAPKATKVTIRSIARQDGVTVSVQDEGPGIPAQDVDRIFDRFFRVTTNNMDTFPGMGLGLYISAQIIRKHGGTISAQSKEGQGAIFSFTLPYTTQL